MSLIASDVVSLFPSMTAENTAKAVKSQAEKSKIEWRNIDTKWLTLYIHMNRDKCSDISKVKHLLPMKRKGKRGPEPGMRSTECMKRYLEDVYENGDVSSWVWPETKPTTEETRLLMAIMLEISVKFFFGNFMYTFGGFKFIQTSGGPIGARVTMCLARLVMQEWWDRFKAILKESDLKEYLRAIYVDDGRMMLEKLKQGVRYVKESSRFEFKKEWLEEDIIDEKSKEDIT